MTQSSTCAYCGVGCGITIEQDVNGVSIKGDNTHPANYGRLCVKGSALGDTIGSDKRLTTPMIDGQRASWEQALNRIADTMARTIAAHGPDSVALYLSGQLLTEDYYVANKWMKGFIGSANVDTNSRLCMASTVVGHKRAFGEDVVPGCYEDLEQADLIIFVGSNAAWNHPVLYQRISAAKANNPDAKVVLIDPRRTATADIADLHLQIKPGTDALLFNALLTGISQSDAINHDYINQHTDGFAAALASAQAECSDPIALSEKLGISLEKLQAFVELFIATPKVVTLFSQGVNQSTSGSDKVNAIINCHLATGRIGKAGMGPFSLTGQPNAMGGREVGGLANQLAAHEDFSDPVGIDRVESFWQAPNIARREGKKAVDMFDALERGEVKVIWIMGTNPVVSMPNAEQVRRALRKAELVIVSECMDATDTLAEAHIALPATTWSEKHGTVTNSDRTISRQRGFLPAPGEARHDWWALCEVAKRMGFADAFDFDSPAAIFREHAALSGYRNHGRKRFNIEALAEISDADYETLAPLRWPVTKAAPKGTTRLFSDGVFSTANGRAQFLPITSRSPVQTVSDDQWLLNTGRLRDQWHTMTRTGRAPKLWQHRAEPIVEMAPADAKAKGYCEGRLMRVSHPQGDIVARLRLEDGQRCGEVFVPMHWTEQYSGNPRVNKLIEAVTDPASGQPEFKHGRVRIKPLATDSQYIYILSAQALENSRLAAFSYWSHSLLEGGHRYAIAIEGEPLDWHAWLADQFGQVAAIRANGCHGKARAAWINAGQLTAFVCVSTDTSAPELSWLGELLCRPLAEGERQQLLAMTPPDGSNSGNVICSCFQVRDTQINKAFEAGAVTLDALQQQLKCGTNCGSCIPEIKALMSA